MLRKSFAMAVAAGLWLGTAPANGATPALQGTVAAGSDFRPFCDTSASCLPFFAAGCPDALVRPDGAVTSVVDVSRLRGKRLSFTWRDVETDLYDDTEATLRNHALRYGTVYFFVVDSCAAPSWPTFILGTEPSGRTQTVKLSDRARWVVAYSITGTAEVHWQARVVTG